MKFPTNLLRLTLRTLGFDAVRVGPHVLLMRDGVATTPPLEEFTLDRHVIDLLNRYQANCVLDVGANAGTYAVNLINNGYTGYVVSVEPVQAAFERLREHAAAYPQWSVHRFAAGKTDGNLEMQVPTNTVFSSFLTLNRYAGERFEDDLVDVHSELVEVKRLDGVLPELIGHIPNPRVFLKMDTQGYDLEVFAGMGDEVDRLVGLQSEVSVIPIYDDMPHFRDAMALFESRGFQISGLFPVNRDRGTKSVIEFDCLMVRPSALPATA